MRLNSLAMTIPPPAASDLDATVSALRALILAGDRYRRAMSAQVDLNLSETVVLSHLADGGGQLTPRDLSRRMILTSGTLTAIIDRLANKRFVTRKVNPDDRRSVIISLEPAGRRTLTRSRRRIERALAAAFAPHPIPPEIADQLTRIALALEQQADQTIHDTPR